MKEELCQQQTHFSVTYFNPDMMAFRPRVHSHSSSSSKSSTASTSSSPLDMPASPVFYSLDDESRKFSDFVDSVGIESRLIEVANRAKARRRSTGMVSLEKSITDFHNFSHYKCNTERSRRNRGNSAPSSTDLTEETQLIDGLLTTTLCSTEL